MLLKATFANVNTGASTLNVGFGANPIVFASGSALAGGEITSEHLLAYNTSTSSWALLTPSTATPPPTTVHNGVDTSITANTITASVSPSISSYSAGHLYCIEYIANTTTAGGVTANFGPGARVASRWDGTALLPGDLVIGQGAVFLDNGTQLRLVSPVDSTPVFLQAAQTYYVNASTGSDSNNGLTSGTAFLTIQKAINTTLSLNMNGYNVSIIVADGTYAPIQCGALNGSGQCFITGNTTTPANCIIHATTGEAINVTGRGWQIGGFAVQADANGTSPHLG
jgi:hypothetical protein